MFLGCTVVSTITLEKSAGLAAPVRVDAAVETANATTAVIYTNGENDLTDAVLKRLNAGAPISATAAPIVTSPSSLLGTNTPGFNLR